MKIIYIANARIPTEKAHGIQIMKMCESFAKKADELELVIPRRINWIKKGPFDYYGIEKCFKIKKLPCLDLIPLDRFIGHLSLWIESITFNFFVLPYIFLKKADIIYTRDKFLLPFVLFKKNVIFEAHAFPKNYFLYSPFLKRLNRVVVITQKLKSLFVAQGISADKILVAPDGVDIKKFNIQYSMFEARKKLNLPQDKKIALYTGHLYKWKGVDVLLETAKQIQSILFVFVGGTKRDIESFKQKAKRLNNVLIAGHKPHPEIPYWLKAADVLILPNSGKENISKYWTSPIKMFEYMASQRPIIASDLPSIREVLNEKNAILVEPDNPKALGRGIKEILCSPKLSDKVSKQALQDVGEYAWEKRAKNILRFIL
jgi:glycosyltransferase involved in cell wall biosynthesis